MLDVGTSIDAAAPLAPHFDACPAVDPYRLPPASVEYPTDPGSNNFGGTHCGHLYLRAAIACVPIKEILGSVIDRHAIRGAIVARHLLERGPGLGKATQPGLLEADPLHGAQPAPVERGVQVIQEHAKPVDG